MLSLCCSLDKLLLNKCASLLFSTVALFCFAEVEDLSSEIEIPEVFYGAEAIWIILQNMMEYDPLSGCKKAD